MDDNRLGITNKIITIDQMVEIADYLVEIKDEYTKLIKEDFARNNNKYLSQGNYNYYVYGSDMPRVAFRITYVDGRSTEFEDLFAFKDELKEPQYIEGISERLIVNYTDNNTGSLTDHRLNVSIYLDRNFSLSTSDKNMRSPLDQIDFRLKKILESGEDRYSGIVKNKFWVKNIIGLAFGSILTLIIFILMLILNVQEMDFFENLFANPIELSLIGWLGAFAFGALLARPFISSLYNEIDKTLNADYHNKKYNEENKEWYKNHNEILLGARYNNMANRKRIESLYSASKKIILVRLVISLIIVLILSII